jgi:Fe-S cluster biosynthesis and repair protein YggX
MLAGAELDAGGASPHNTQPMARMVQCVKLGKEAEGLEKPPIRGPLGQKVFEQVSKEAWQLWVAHSTMVVNEYRLELGTPEATKVWLAELEKFFFGEGSKAPEGYVPPSATADKKPEEG